MSINIFYIVNKATMKKILIVGKGITGSSISYHLSKRMNNVKIICADKHHPIGGATTHSAGMIINDVENTATQTLKEVNNGSKEC